MPKKAFTLLGTVAAGTAPVWGTKKKKKHHPSPGVVFPNRQRSVPKPLPAPGKTRNLSR